MNNKLIMDFFLTGRIIFFYCLSTFIKLFKTEQVPILFYVPLIQSHKFLIPWTIQIWNCNAAIF